MQRAKPEHGFSKPVGGEQGGEHIPFVETVENIHIAHNNNVKKKERQNKKTVLISKHATI